jgi:gluconate 2-dehydrogenase subunit 3-like protein
MGRERLGTQATNVIARLVGLLAPQYPTLDTLTRSGVERDVSAFVGSQIQSMPSFLRLPYRIALVAFNWLAILRYGNTFVSLTDDRATAYLTLWSNEGLGLNRDFVKLIRSCALLAYFDHPAVRTEFEAAHAPQPAAQRAVGNGLD